MLARAQANVKCRRRAYPQGSIKLRAPASVTLTTPIVSCARQVLPPRPVATWQRDTEVSKARYVSCAPCAPVPIQPFALIAGPSTDAGGRSVTGLRLTNVLRATAITAALGEPKFRTQAPASGGDL